MPLAILFRYSLNQFVPGKFMVEALTVENYVKFFTDPYYTGVLARRCGSRCVTPSICLLLGFPLAYVLARTQSALQERADHAGGAAAVRRQRGARGRLDGAVRQQGLAQREPDGARRDHEPLEIMFTETAVIIGIIAVNLPFMVLTLQSVIEGIDRAVEEAAFSLGAAPLTMFRARAVAAGAAGHPRRHHPHLHPGDERLCDAGAARRPAVQDDGAAGVRPVLQHNNWPFGGAVAFVLMTATLILTLAANLIVQQRYRARAA